MFEFDALSDGIEPGGLRNKDDIKVLICYLLKSARGRVSRDLLGDVMQDQGIANYFEAMDAVSELLQSGNITSNFEDDREFLEITDSGSRAVLQIEHTLPKTVREKAVRSMLKFLTLERNERENNVKIDPTDGGYNMSFTMSDGDIVLMELHMFVPNSDEAQRLKDNFIEDPARVYSTILAALMVD